MKEDRGDKDLELVIQKLKLQVRFLNEQIAHTAKRIKDLEDISEGHRKLNGELRKEIQYWKEKSSESEKDKNLLQGYKKVIEDLSKQMVRK